MFGGILLELLTESRFPRVRGDVPSYLGWECWETPFSPRARGCSRETDMDVAAQLVFPACAGMFPITTYYIRLYIRFPRVRGDVPVQAWGSGTLA